METKANEIVNYHDIQNYFIEVKSLLTKDYHQKFENMDGMGYEFITPLEKKVSMTFDHFSQNPQAMPRNLPLSNSPNRRRSPLLNSEYIYDNELNRHMSPKRSRSPVRTPGLVDER